MDNVALLDGQAASQESNYDRSAAATRGHRTRRLREANKPFVELDAEAQDLQKRIDSGDVETRDKAQALLRTLALRKDLQAAQDRRTEVVMKLEEVDVRAELEELKEAIGLRG